MKNKKITILYGGETSEREVSLRTGQAMYNVLTAGGYQHVKLLDATRANITELVNERPDVCLMALHGKHGEDGLMQGYLEMLNIPYTGSGVAASAVAFDKYLTKLCFDAKQIPTAKYWLAGEEDEELLSTLKTAMHFQTCVVKPSREGSTVGISIVKAPADYDKAVAEAAKYDKKVLVEAFIEGKELTIAIFEGRALPAIWIKPNSGFYDYQSKYTKGATQYLFDTALNKEDTTLINETALAAYQALGCDGVARVDIIFDGKT
ncbi:MAG: D-alanine--D-alanine ligase, partial [Deferribacteraceae bacterium]|nr:D-alanine--D-alanine ligase [Deferribacteraceae bacterium]